MIITAARGAADRPLSIQEVLLSDEQAALARGFAELQKGEPTNTVTISCRYTSVFKPGDVVKFIDPIVGVDFYGRISSQKITINGIDEPGIFLDLSIERWTKWQP